MPFFIPDRSNRPPDEPDDIPCRVAVDRDQLRTHALADGRVAVVEADDHGDAVSCSYFFDATGIETAGEAELTALLRASGLDPRASDEHLFHSAALTVDAQGRPIWAYRVLFA
jgi:hypothetical protein